MHLKRLLVLPLAAGLLVAGSSMASAGEITGTGERTGAYTVSYTHLTLPTILLV